MIARRPDWRPRLVAYLEGVRAQPFAFGQHDCALFAAGAVEAMTGVDLAEGYRGRYDSLKAGLKLVRGGHLALLRQSFDPIPPAFAGVGDLALIGEVGFPAFGIFEGQHVLVLREEGLGLMPRAAATQAYRVP
jgi:hypothetical protein